MNAENVRFIYLYRHDSIVANDLFHDWKTSGHVDYMPILKRYSRFNYYFCTKYARIGNYLSKNSIFKSYYEKQLGFDLYDIKDKAIVIIINSGLDLMSFDVLEVLFQKKNVIPILILVDSISKISESARLKVSMFSSSNVYTFDRLDAKKFGYTYFYNYYSVLFDNKRSEYSITSDVFFCGQNKNRINQIYRLYDLLSAQSIKMDFRILGVQLKERKNFDGLTYLSHRVKYAELLRCMMHSRCILDITQPGQYGITIRYFEAVCYNKKLITDNKLVRDMPFYNPEYIQIFDDINNIDTEWIKRNCKVDYEYNGCFSPLNLLYDIRKRFV